MGRQKEQAVMNEGGSTTPKGNTSRGRGSVCVCRGCPRSKGAAGAVRKGEAFCRSLATTRGKKGGRARAARRQADGTEANAGVWAPPPASRARVEVATDEKATNPGGARRVHTQ